MNTTTDCPLAAALAERMRQQRDHLVARWLDRLVDRFALNVNEVFPTDDLLNHIPLLVEGIADYVEDPAEEITADVPLVAKAMELGELRYTQGSDAHQILREYEILGGVLFSFLIRAVDEIDEPCTPGEMLVCGHRLFRAVVVIQQFTTIHFLRLGETRVREREERLRSFNRTVSHELKNRIGAARGAVELLCEDWLSDDAQQRARFLGMVGRNLLSMQETLTGLIELSRLTTEGGHGRNVLLPAAAAEVKRQLREFAEARGVRIHLAERMPEAAVPAAVVELALSNYISNAIKYRDPAAAAPTVWVDAEIAGTEGKEELVVRVRDNGLGVPEDARDQLFQRFFRAHTTVTGEEGSGLGLSIVRETVESIGGRAWAEFPETGSVFAFALPLGDGALSDE